MTVVNYFQTTERRLESARKDGSERQLTIREWLIGGPVGRAYVPARPDIDAEPSAVEPTPSDEQRAVGFVPTARSDGVTDPEADRPSGGFEASEDD